MLPYDIYYDTVPLMITCTLVNIICLQWQDIVTVMSVPYAFEFVACTVIVALPIAKKNQLRVKNKLGTYPSNF